jgi:hypothetical protein
MDEKRIEGAEEFLREAVYRSRASQAVSTLLAKGGASDRGNCGLGEKAAVALDLSPRGRELFEQLFDSRGAVAADELARVQACMRHWIEAQDALDRKRNHFLKAFRHEHGFDRTRYSPAEVAELDSGLARVNEEEDRERRSAAQALLGG